jgi:hypothetical protein
MTQQIVNDLRTINFDVERAFHSWTVFETSTRDFGPNQEALIDAIDSRKVGPTINHLQMVLLHDAVSSICRATDNHQPDVISVNSVMIAIRSTFKDRYPEEIKKLEQLRKAILKFEPLAEIRTFRNNQLGHTLRHETPPTGYKDIPVIVENLIDFLEAAFKLCGDARWIGQISKSRMTKLSNEFWNCLEDGASARTKSEELHK